MSGCSLVVLKLGSSVLRDEADLPRAAAEVAGHVARGWRVLAVVSAIGNGTDELVRRAAAVAGDARHETPGAQTALAALLGTGEAVTAALVGMALERRGIGFNILDVGRIGPFTRGPLLDAHPHALDTAAVKRALAEHPVAIPPGFVGRDGDGRATLLGRGGSDLSALFAAHALRAERCRLLKDVDGIYEHDPALRGLAAPRRFAALDWDGALRLQDAILQQKAAQFAFRHRVVFEVGACGGGPGTLVGAAESRFAPTSPAAGTPPKLAAGAQRSAQGPAIGAVVPDAGGPPCTPRRQRRGAIACAALAAEGGLAS